MKIKEIADAATVARQLARGDDSGLLVKTVWAAADPDARFQECVRPLFRGPLCTHIFKKKKVAELAKLLGVPKPTMKKYLVGAGIINQSV